MNRTGRVLELLAAALLAATAANANYNCVANAEAQFAGLATTETKISLWYRTPGGVDTSPPFPQILTTDGSFLSQLSHIGVGHVQGLQRIVVDGVPHFAYTADATVDGRRQTHLFIGRLASKLGFGYGPIDINRSSGAHSAPQSDHNIANLGLNLFFTDAHVGGIQVVDDFALIPVYNAASHRKESVLHIVDIADPERPTRIPGSPVLLPEVRKGDAVGAVAMGAGMYRLAVRWGKKDGRGVKTRRIEFYDLTIESGAGGQPVRGHLSHRSGIERTEPFPAGAGFDGYQSINLLEDCGTRVLYLVGFNDKVDKRCGGLSPTSGSSYADLFRIDHSESAFPALTRVGRREFGDLTGAGCAGAGIYVDDRGGLSAYFMKHWGVLQPPHWHGVMKIFELSSNATRRTGLTLHEDAHFRSKSRRFVTDVWNLGDYRLNDNVGSVEVHSGEWELCVNPGHIDCVRVDRNVAHLGDWNLNNKLSSVRRVVEQNPRLVGDVDGDGRADAVMFGDRRVYVALGHEDGGFEPARPSLRNLTYNSGGWRIEKHPRLLGDVDGDGRSDIVGFGSWRVFVSLGRSDGTFAPARATIQNFTYSAGGWRIEKHPRLLGDVNGDGRSDIVGFGGSRVFVALGQADGTFAPARATIPNFTYRAGWRSERHVRLLGDVNGDGRSDIVGLGRSWVTVALGRSDGTFSAARSVLANFTEAQGWRVSRHARMLGDVNGDGRSDIVGFGGTAVWVAYGRSDGRFSRGRPALYDLSEAQGWRADRHLRLLADLDGDGRDDVVGFGGTSVFVATARWNGTFSPVAEAFAGLAYADGWRLGVHPRRAADIDGDGSEDIVGFGSRHVFLSLGDSLGELSEPRVVLGNLLY